MALYWPDKKVALDIVDDPNRRPFEGDESYTVVRVTCADLADYDSFRRVTEHLCALLDHELPHSTEWEAGNRMLYETLMAGGLDWENPDLFQLLDESLEAGTPTDLEDMEIVAHSEKEALLMQSVAERTGQRIRGVSLWEGPVPKGSFEDVSDTLRMSTPEYFFLRKANQLPLPIAVSMGIELCGKYRTVLTQYTREGGYDFLRNQRTNKARIRSYLRGARGTKEYKRAKRVLRLVSEGCSSPMGCYLYLLMCLPRSAGSYGLDRAILSGAFESDEGFLPSAVGKYLAYDLVWPDKRVAVQFTGNKMPGEKHLDALNTQDMQTVCVTFADIQDPDRFDKIARHVASLLDTLPPDPTDSWLAARDKLREQVAMPTFPHMRLTLRDVEEHMVA